MNEFWQVIYTSGHFNTKPVYYNAKQGVGYFNARTFMDDVLAQVNAIFNNPSKIKAPTSGQMIDFDKVYTHLDTTQVGKTWQILEDFYFNIARFDEGNFPNSFFEAVATFLERYY